MTIPSVCVKCKHFHNKEPGSVRGHMWYNHLCLASPLPTKANPYDGKEEAYGVNDLGGTYFTTDKFHFCRSINPDGSCQKFSKRESVE